MTKIACCKRSSSCFLRIVVFLFLLSSKAAVLAQDISCTNSTQCADTEYCSTQGDPREGRAVCMACNAPENGMGCVGAWAIPGGIEECKTRCAEQYECSTHDDCVGANSTDSGDWCSQNLRCNPCDDGACWTLARIKGAKSVVARELPPLSINFACPKACCDWGFDSNFNTGEEEAIGPCDPSVTITAYWTADAEADMAPMSAMSGKACNTKVYDFRQEGLEIYDPDGYPEKVTLITCDFGTDNNTDICLDEVTISAIAKKGNNVTFLSDFYPFKTNILTTECLGVVIGGILTGMLIGIIIAAIVGCCCIIGLIFLCWKMCCNND